MVAHALFGDEQHTGAHHQHTADDVEQGGAHAAGFGQGGTLVVRDGDIDYALLAFLAQHILVVAGIFIA